MTKKSPSASAVALTALMGLKRIGRRTAIKIMSEAKRGLDEANYKEFLFSQIATLNTSESELHNSWIKAIEQLMRSVDAGIDAHSYFDKEYPARLRDTPDPPAVLFTLGNAEALSSSCSIAIVGTREPTKYGVEVATRSGRTAAHEGFAVVSGLAHGCDSYAHKGCVEAQGVGVAVLAHGLDRIYPVANRELADQLLGLRGCWASEYPIGTSPVRAAFAERDRIQSGLSDGVLVIETDVKGGTMHTVNFSRQQHRPLACISHPSNWLSEDKTKGNQKLISSGMAIPIEDNKALLRFFSQIKNRNAEVDDANIKNSSASTKVPSDECVEPKQMSLRFK